MRFLRTIAILIFVGPPTGCALETASTRNPAPQQTSRSSTSQPLDAKQTARVQRVMMPLLRATNNPRLLNEIRVRVIDDPKINAANAAGGEFHKRRNL
jgi:predicted Zn-dependent protease